MKQTLDNVENQIIAQLSHHTRILSLICWHIIELVGTRGEMNPYKEIL